MCVRHLRHSRSLSFPGVQVNKAHSLIGNAAVLSREGFDTFVMLKQRVIEHIWRVFRNKLLMVEEEV